MRGDVGALMEVIGKRHPMRSGLMCDVERAHRLMPIDERDWGYLACRVPGATVPEATPDDEVPYSNTSGTIGVGSGSYWWSTVFAVVVRVIHKALGTEEVSYHLVYVDGGLAIALGGHFERSICGSLLLLRALGVPLAARKIRGGLEMEWLGSWLDLRKLKLRASERRHEWARGWCVETASSEVVLFRRLREGLGRLNLLAVPIVVLRPFLGHCTLWWPLARPALASRST